MLFTQQKFTDGWFLFSSLICVLYVQLNSYILTVTPLRNKLYISCMVFLLSKKRFITFLYSLLIRFLLSDFNTLDPFEITFLHQSDEIKNHPYNPIPNFDEEEKIDDSHKYEAPVVSLWFGLFTYICIVSVIFYFTGSTGEDDPSDKPIK